MNGSPKKLTVALELLERASMFVHLDPRRPGVVVPRGFLKQAQLVLQIGLNMSIAIPDLDVGEAGIGCTLSFDKRPHFCRLPWPAVYALIGEQGGGMVWHEDVPPEVIADQKQHLERKGLRPVEPVEPVEPVGPKPQPAPPTRVDTSALRSVPSRRSVPYLKLVR